MCPLVVFTYHYCYYLRLRHCHWHFSLLSQRFLLPSYLSFFGFYGIWVYRILFDMFARAHHHHYYQSNNQYLRLDIFLYSILTQLLWLWYLAVVYETNENQWRKGAEKQKKQRSICGKFVHRIAAAAAAGQCERMTVSDKRHKCLSKKWEMLFCPWSNEPNVLFPYPEQNIHALRMRTICTHSAESLRMRTIQEIIDVFLFSFCCAIKLNLCWTHSERINCFDLFSFTSSTIA